MLPCNPPTYEGSLIAAYVAEPLLRGATFGLPIGSSAASPAVRHFCDEVGVEDRVPGRQITVSVGYGVGELMPLSVLADRVQPAATANGWIHAGHTDGERVASVSFCKKIVGITSIATLGERGGISITAAPEHHDCRPPSSVDIAAPLGPDVLAKLRAQGAPARWALHMYGHCHDENGSMAEPATHGRAQPDLNRGPDSMAGSHEQDPPRSTPMATDSHTNVGLARELLPRDP